MARVTQIVDLSHERRLPREGRIRLGIKEVAASGKEFPRDVHYFVTPPEVRAVYGPEPTELDVMVPLENQADFMPTRYASYKASGLFCEGNGARAWRRGEDDKWVERGCTCELLESGDCKRNATLNVILPKITMGGVYQIVTSSWNSIVDVQSGADYIRALIGRVALVPLTLRRIEATVTHEGKKRKHYPMQLVFRGNTDDINALRDDKSHVHLTTGLTLPPPPELDPDVDPGGASVDMETGEVREPDRLEKDFELRILNANTVAEVNLIMHEIVSSPIPVGELAHIATDRIKQIKEHENADI